LIVTVAPDTAAPLVSLTVPLRIPEVAMAKFRFVVVPELTVVPLLCDNQPLLEVVTVYDPGAMEVSE
jgi:hypothetical protein